MKRSLAHDGIAATAALALLLAPRVGEACAVCMSGRDDETRLAFIATTGLLTVLPLALIGGLVWYLVRRARRLERESELVRPLGSARESGTARP